MKVVRFFLRTSTSLLILAILAGIICGLANTSFIALINRVLSSQGFSVNLMAAAFFGLCILTLISRIVSEVLVTRLGQQSIFNLRIELSRRILTIPLRQLEELGAPRLLATLTDDIAALTNAVIAIPIICISIASLALCFIYIAWLSWVVFLLAAVFTALGLATYQLLAVRAQKALRQARNQQDSLFKHLRALMEGNKELKLHQSRRESFFSQLLEPTATTYRNYSISGYTLYTIAGSWGELLSFVLIGLLLFALPLIKYIDTATLTGCTITILYTLGPLNIILNSVTLMGRAEIAYGKIESLGVSLAAVEKEKLVKSPVIQTKVSSKLEFKGITHSYYREKEDNNFTLGPIDLTINSSEIIFLIGGNGSGKTTLAKLITGLYLPEKGEIRLNDQLITEENREYYRQHFSVIFTDFYLFENLLGLENAALDEKAHNYLVALQLDHKVEVKNGSLSTVALSQGQRKRLALLTSYLEDRPYYIFDEWASDQDPIFKELFYTKLLPELKKRGKTVIVITHDDKYFYLADRLLKMNYGNLSDLQMRLPITISVINANGNAFLEQNETLQVNNTSLLFLLSQKINIDTLIHVSLPMPQELRLFDYDQPLYQAYAQVREVKREDSTKFIVRASIISKSNPKSSGEVMKK